jgi:cytochrome c553
MINKSKVSVVATLFALVSTSVYASAEFIPKTVGDVVNGEKIFREGKQLVAHPDAAGQTVAAQAGEAQAGIEVPPCLTCHGEKAMGDDNMGTPRLAGQGYSFLVKQLTDFATDKRTDTTMFVMNNNAKGLSAKERQDVAAYLSGLNKGEIKVEGSDLAAVKAMGQTPVGQTHLGKSLAQYGAPDRGIPACHSCHGYNARGAFPVYPALSGQKYVYLVNQLKKWRDASRANDMMGQMRAVAKKLSDDDIYNVASFLTSAERTTVGNARTPQQQH